MKKWIIKNSIECSEILHENKLVNNLLISRGFQDITKVDRFLKGDLQNLHDPLLLKDIDRAIDRIDIALQRREKVLIYGDYDVDGITSTSILYRALTKLGVDVCYYIPDRMNEGYGINKEAIDYISTLVIDLIITVDCGISSIEEVEYAKALGLDIIITDHHECKEIIPNTIVINPKRKDCLYPFKNLAGCGVAFKLVQALWTKYELVGYEEFLDIAAIGTIADVVDLTDENRLIVKNGLERMAISEKCGIKALKTVAGINKELNSTNVAFQISPRINAAGRLSDAKIAVELFTTNDDDKALQIAKFLDQENKKRQEIEDTILNDAIYKIENEIDIRKEKIIVLSSPNWHIGVVGIVASRLLERYSRPVLLLCEEGDTSRGSGRSIEGFNLFENLSECSELLLKFGGHELAAGLSMENKNIEKLREKLNCLAEKVDIECFAAKVSVDSYVETEIATIDTARILKMFEPFGAGNPSPIFYMDKVNVVNKRFIGAEGKHLKLQLEKNDVNFNAIMFNGTKIVENKSIEVADIIFNMDINEWNNTETLQFILKGIKPHVGWIKENLLDSYYKNLKSYIKSNALELEKFYAFKNINLLEKNMKFVKEFIYFKKGYILVSTMNSVKELEELLDTTGIVFNHAKDEDSQIILCPDIEKINFEEKSVLIYDFLPSIYNYKTLLSKTSEKVFNFYDASLNANINNFIEKIELDEVAVIKLLDDLSKEDLTCTINSIAEKYNINPYKAFNMIKICKSLGYINIFVKGEMLKIQKNEDKKIDFELIKGNDIEKNETINVKNSFSSILEKIYI